MNARYLLKFFTKSPRRIHRNAEWVIPSGLYLGCLLRLKYIQISSNLQDVIPVLLNLGVGRYVQSTVSSQSCLQLSKEKLLSNTIIPENWTSCFWWADSYLILPSYGVLTLKSSISDLEEKSTGRSQVLISLPRPPYLEIYCCRRCP